MGNYTQTYSQDIFEQAKKTDENGKDYWSARELAKIFEYSEYRHFIPVIDKAKEACKSDRKSVQDHFEDVLEMIEIGKGGKRLLESFRLSHFACFLLASNIDRNKQIAPHAIAYFTVNEYIDNESLFDLPIRKLTIKDEMSDFLLYTTPQGNVNVETILSDETIWLSQEQMATLFDVLNPAISRHLRNIFDTHELDENSVVSKMETTAQDGKIYWVKYYNLDAVISVGYRVNSTRATQFRIWATNTLKEYIIKGFAMDDDRLKNGRYFGKDYFEELLERVRSIRASERRIYQKITDVFSECSIDYDKNSSIAHEFYAEVQNKFHYAITGHTASEIIYNNADAGKEFMGLKTWKNAPQGRVLKSDVVIAKNYLRAEEIENLEHTITSYFDYIERLIKKRTTFTMTEFAVSVVKFLEFNEYDILQGKGSVRKSQAESKAFSEYETFNKRQKIESDFDRIIKKIEKWDIDLPDY